MKLTQKLTLTLVLVSAAVLSSCGSSTSPTATEGKVKFSVRSVAPPSTVGLNKTQVVGQVTITKAKIVINEIEFENELNDSLDFELEEPFVHDLAADTSLHTVAVLQVPFGMYKELSVKVKKLRNDDGAVFTQNPELQNLSVYVEGFLDNDTSKKFIFTSDLTAKQKQKFNPPLVIDSTQTSTNVVLSIDLSRWFVDRSGNPLDPKLPDNRSQIENNIKASFKMFKDDDDDGREDGDDD
ncbi:MAG: hypothetical protein D6715_11525 [Calditrichaeota bacterium]|nr:MAG: hypothetical protein D6715_11525 [Calditrichota bacterium]